METTTSTSTPTTTAASTTSKVRQERNLEAVASDHQPEPGGFNLRGLLNRSRSSLKEIWTRASFQRQQIEQHKETIEFSCPVEGPGSSVTTTATSETEYSSDGREDDVKPKNLAHRQQKQLQQRTKPPNNREIERKFESWSQKVLQQDEQHSNQDAVSLPHEAGGSEAREQGESSVYDNHEAQNREGGCCSWLLRSEDGGFKESWLDGFMRIGFHPKKEETAEEVQIDFSCIDKIDYTESDSSGEMIVEVLPVSSSAHISNSTRAQSKRNHAIKEHIQHESVDKKHKQGLSRRFKTSARRLIHKANLQRDSTW